MPGNNDEAWIEYFHLGQGIDGFRTQFVFGPGIKDPFLPMGKVHGSLDWPILWFTYFSEGHALASDGISGREIQLGPNGAYFRHAAQFEEFYKIDTRGPAKQIDLTFRGPALLGLLGEEGRDELLEALELKAVPSARARPIPASVAEILRALFPDNLSGRIRILYSQAKALELVSVLIHHFRANRPEPQGKTSDLLLPQLREELLQSTGTIPLLSELAEKYGASARQLNNDFKQRYGSTIYAFIINNRLDMAYDMVKLSDRPLKVIGAELGYSTINNFQSAFKRRHGVTPGKLRKGAVDEGQP